MIHKQRTHRHSRRGAVAVEFAIVAPVLLAIVLGVAEVNQLVAAQNLLETAAREGARFGAMDRTGMVGGGGSNAKLIQDVKNFLAAQGLSADDVTVDIKHPGTEDAFDLDNPNNDLQLFEVHVELPYSSISSHDLLPGENYNLEAVVTFRNARATMSN
jgi:hypothetical protein